MAKYDKETKFYWIQLKEDFFEEDAIEWLEEQENGHKYSLFYLKLCLKSLKTNGILIRKVGDMLVPYDNKKLAEMTKMPVDTVIVAMELLKGIGLIKVMENGELYMSQLENMIGSTSKGALKKAQQRALKKEQDHLLLEEPDNEGTKGGQMSTKDKDKDKTKVKDKNIDKKESKKIYGEYKNIRLTDKEYQSLISDYGSSTTEQCITYLDEYIEMKGTKYKSHYLVIRKWVLDAVTKPKTNNRSNNKPIREEVKPDWLGKEIVETSIEELPEEQKQKAEELRKRLREKYGKEQIVDVDEEPITLDF